MADGTGSGKKGVAETLDGERLRRKAVIGEKAGQLNADSIDTRFVVGPGVDIHQCRQQRDHALLLRRYPFKDRGFLLFHWHALRVSHAARWK